MSRQVCKVLKHVLWHHTWICYVRFGEMISSRRYKMSRVPYLAWRTCLGHLAWIARESHLRLIFPFILHYLNGWLGTNNHDNALRCRGLSDIFNTIVFYPQGVALAKNRLLLPLNQVLTPTQPALLLSISWYVIWVLSRISRPRICSISPKAVILNLRVSRAIGNRVWAKGIYKNMLRVTERTRSGQSIL